LKKQVAEIEQNPLLTIFGFFLTFTHALTFLFLRQNRYSYVVTRADENVCWPFFPWCHEIPWSSAGLIRDLLDVYLAIAILTLIAFTFRKIRLAYGLSIVLFVSKFILLSMSYKFMGNYHYMPQIVQLLWLFVPGKFDLIRLIVVSFYLAAGLIKFNTEWLSGAALIQAPVLKGPLLSFALHAVVFLETVLVFGLLSSRRWLQGAVLAALVGFHVFSWHIVGYFYPSIMACLLSIFVLNLIHWDPSENRLLLRLFEMKFPKPTLVVLVIFFICQAIPQTLAKDSALGGIHRLAALNMMDAWAECSPVLIQEQPSGGFRQFEIFKTSTAVRTKCDPIVFLNQLQRMCESAPASDLRFLMYSRRSTDTEFKLILDVPRACERKSTLLWAEAF
jgi:hypothetical protein